MHLLCPRITSAIRYAFPQLYLEWTTGVAAADDTNNRDGSSRHGVLIRKRWIEMVLHISMLVGSCHFSSKRQRNNNNSKETSVYLATPAMRNLGMILRPTSTSTAAKNEHPLSSKIKVYSKIVALVLVTVVVPALYEELKLHRQKQLERQETRLRLAQLSREFRSTNGNGVEQEQQQQQQPRESIRQQQGDTLQRRAQKRKTFIQKFIVDSILGMSDILIPPLQLVNYLSYLWGLSYTPNIGSSLIGWEYASITDCQSSSSLSSGILNPFQRHANFQYANRRLMVEEGLRTMAAILPPRRNTPDNSENERSRRRSVEDDNTDNSDNDRPNANNSNTTTHISPQRRMSWMRQRALSFMGVVEEEEKSEHRPYDKNNELKCSLCQTLNPSIPYMTSCGHCYCYLCLRMSVTDDPYYRCVCCRKRVGTSARVSTTTTLQ